MGIDHFYHKKHTFWSIFSHKKIHHFDPSFSDLSYLGLPAYPCPFVWLLADNGMSSSLVPSEILMMPDMSAWRCSGRGKNGLTKFGNWPRDSGQVLAIFLIFMDGTWWETDDSSMDLGPLGICLRQTHSQNIPRLLMRYSQVQNGHLRRPTRNEANSGKALCN